MAIRAPDGANKAIKLLRNECFHSIYLFSGSPVRKVDVGGVPGLRPPSTLEFQRVCCLSSHYISGSRCEVFSFWLIRNFAEETVKYFFELVETAGVNIPQISWEGVPQFWTRHLKTLSS